MASEDMQRLAGLVDNSVSLAHNHMPCGPNLENQRTIHEALDQLIIPCDSTVHLERAQQNRLRISECQLDVPLAGNGVATEVQCQRSDTHLRGGNSQVCLRPDSSFYNGRMR